MKKYQLKDGPKVTLPEIKDMLKDYDLNAFNTFYYSIFDKELKEALKPYFIERMFNHGGLSK